MNPPVRNVATLPGRRSLAARGGARLRAAALRVELDPFRTFLFILTIITISRIHQHFPVIALARPALVMTLAAGIYAYLNPRLLAPEGLLRTWPAKVMLGFGVLACLSVPFGISIGNAGLFILESYSKTLLFGLLVVVAIRDVRDLYAFVWAIAISTGVLVWMSLFVFGLSDAGSHAERLNDLYTYDANDVGLVLLVGLGLTLLVLRHARRLPRLAATVVLFGIGAALARTGSRGAFLGALVVGAALLVLLRGVSLPKRLGIVALAGVALLLFAPRGYWDQMRTLNDPKSDYNWTSASGRRMVAKRGLGYMWSHPVFGIGIGNFGMAECTISELARNYRDGGLKCSAPHNSYIQAGAETGVPGLVLWVVAVFGSIGAMLRLRRRIPRGWRRGDAEQRFLADAPTCLAVSMVGFAVTSAFVSFAWMDPIYLLLALMAGLYTSVERKARELATSTRVGFATSAVRPT